MLDYLDNHWCSSKKNGHYYKEWILDTLGMWGYVITGTRLRRMVITETVLGAHLEIHSECWITQTTTGARLRRVAITGIIQMVLGALERLDIHP